MLFKYYYILFLFGDIFVFCGFYKSKVRGKKSVVFS